MRTRILPTAEWPRLQGTEAETLWPHLNPQEAQVVVVEEDGAIVGTWVVLRVVHVECVWVAPAYRRTGSVARRLLRGMRAAAARWHARTVVTSALTDEVRDLIRQLHGQRLPGDHFVIPVGRV